MICPRCHSETKDCGKRLSGHNQRYVVHLYWCQDCHMNIELTRFDSNGEPTLDSAVVAAYNEEIHTDGKIAFGSTG